MSWLDSTACIICFAVNDRELNIHSPTHLTLHILEVIFPALLEYVRVISGFVRVVVIWNIVRVLRPLCLLRTLLLFRPLRVVELLRCAGNLRTWTWRTRLPCWGCGHFCCPPYRLPTDTLNLLYLPGHQFSAQLCWFPPKSSTVAESARAPRAVLAGGR
jgi:hypothetical protein